MEEDKRLHIICKQRKEFLNVWGGGGGGGEYTPSQRDIQELFLELKSTETNV